jgi:hypothetical protein
MLEALVVAAWLLPALFVCMALVGYLHGHRLRVGKTSKMIIQITTIGNQETVNKIIRTIRDYHLPIPYRIWVVTEPWSRGRYLGADRVIVVPQEFTCRASHKARALEYSRLLRERVGLIQDEVKILFVDDDSLPTKDYIVKAFFADYDICQGIVIPRNGYGRFLSHMDDLRTLNCLVMCSIFQGFGHPLWVHGEGLCVRTTAEAVVTWDYPVFASEDLVFGQMAAAKGLHWGFFYDYIYITSPWSWRDYLKQRRRWMWGNIHAVQHVLPIGAKVLITSRYLLGFGSFFVATIGTVVDLAGWLAIPTWMRPSLFFTLVLWLGLFALAGWVNSGGSKKHALISMALAWVISAANIIVLLMAMYMGNPRRFEVIEKVRKDKVVPEPAFARSAHAQWSEEETKLNTK